MSKWVFLLLSIGLGAAGQVFFKQGAMLMQASGLEGIERFLNYFIFIGLVLYGLSTVLWLLALQTMELSFAYPMVSLGYVLVVAASYLIFHEPISLMRVLGLALILAGIVVVARS